jgi:sulfite reductase beta subunit-like hemoprotein
MAKKSDSGAGVLLVVGLVFAALAAAYEWAKNNLLIVGLVIVGVTVTVALSRRAASKRREARFRKLVERFGSEEIAHDIMSQKFWPGQTEEMLTESLGVPEAVDKQILKTKRKEVWKYGEGRRNQFSLKITVENGRVVAWDQKSS